MLTSTYPFVNGVRTTGFDVLPSSARTLAEIMKEHGYHTAAIIAAFPLDNVFGLNQGFDYYEDYFTRSMTGNQKIQRNNTVPDLSNWTKAKDFIGKRRNNDAERTASEVTDAALKWLRQRPKGPFFLWVHYFDPHIPHRQPKRFLDMVRRNASAYEKDKFSISYDAEILYMDQEFGRFLYALRDMELIDKSFLVLHGDHGEEAGLHGTFGHGVNLYEATVHVPLIFRGADWSKNYRVIQPVSLLDVVPTIIETLVLSQEPTSQGHSLFPLQTPCTSLPLEPAYLGNTF